MGWRMRELYCPLSSAVYNATIPTLPFQHYHSNITINIWDGRIYMFAFLLHYLLFIKLFVFLSCMHNCRAPISRRYQILNWIPKGYWEKFCPRLIFLDNILSLACREDMPSKFKIRSIYLYLHAYNYLQPSQSVPGY